jgi:prepilin-type N-terminal cleavage/methylation domain-containing protein
MSHPKHSSQAVQASAPRARAVTLIELIVVLACLGAAAAIVLPGFSSLPSMELRSAAE